MRVCNLYAGPGTGKSTTAAALFAELKYQGYNTELVTEYAKSATWEKRGPKIFQAQEYIFGKQSFSLSRVASEVEFVITDSPLLQGIVYMADDAFPSLQNTIKEAYDRYENLDVFIRRADLTVKAYNPKGRNQTEQEAILLDGRIKQILNHYKVDYYEVDFSRSAVQEIIELMRDKGWVC